jgi:hypothetical protein
MNIECSKELLDELESAFRFNDAVLRHLTISCKAAETEKSAMMKEVEREESAKFSDRKPAASTEEVATTAKADEDGAAAATAELVAEAEVIAEMEVVAEADAAVAEEAVAEEAVAEEAVAEEEVK